MSDPLLTILKFCFLAILYLFFMRVLRAVWAEVTGPQVVVPTPARPARGGIGGVGSGKPPGRLKVGEATHTSLATSSRWGAPGAAK